MYLGFHLTEHGIKPGKDKLKAVAAAAPPANVKQVRQFLGLCNFFRAHIRNFSIIASPLTQLTKKESLWRKGPLSSEAETAFRTLQSMLVSEPVLDYPRRDRTYALITDAACGDDKNEGGLGAILTQIDSTGEHRVIGYASRKLIKHEKNYTPFLLEMQASIWGMEHFETHLRGRHFKLFTDHKPMEKLGKVHTKTLLRLQEMMGLFDFQIIYKKGSEMPADFLSRQAVDSINVTNEFLAQEQRKDPLIRDIRRFLLNRGQPQNPTPERVAVIQRYVRECFIENDLVWRRSSTLGKQRTVIFAPKSLVPAILQDAHGHLLTGHDGINKTRMRISNTYYWPFMNQDIANHILTCHRCQLRRVDQRPPPQLLSPLPQCTEPNQRIHADLFGPLRTEDGKKYVLCITDAFTKYVELVAVPDKEAVTVTSAIFNR